MHLHPPNLRLPYPMSRSLLHALLLLLHLILWMQLSLLILLPSTILHLNPSRRPIP